MTSKYINIPSDEEVKNTIPADVTSFGELTTATRSTVVEAKFFYNINTRTFTNLSANGGSVSTVNRAASLSTSTATNGIASLKTVAVVDYKVSQKIEFSNTFLFPNVSGAVGSQVGVNNCRMQVGAFNGSDGIYWGFDNNETFSIFYKRSGSETKINQSNFNLDKLDGTSFTNGALSQYSPDWTKLQLIRVCYSWHGTSPFIFQIQNPSGTWITFHKETFINTSIVSNIGTPSLPLAASIKNTGNNTNLSIIWQAGQISYLGEELESSNTRTFSARTEKTVGSTLVPILSIRSKSTYESLANFISSKIEWLSVASSGNKTVNFVVIFQATLTGAVWSDVDATNSVVEVDTSATSFSGGYEVIPIVVGGSDSFAGIIKALQGQIYPGQTVTIAATSSNSNEVRAGVTWQEFH